MAYDHTKALDYWKLVEQEGQEIDEKKVGSLLKDAAELSGCISHWGWYTTDEDSKNWIIRTSILIFTMSPTR